MFAESFRDFVPWVFPILCPIVFPILIMLIFWRRMFGCFQNRSMTDTDSRAPRAKEENTPLETLKMRLANGEITTEQFQEMKKAIES